MAELLGILFTGLLGYALGASKAKGFEKLIDAARDRVNHLAYFKVIPPLRLFKEQNITATFYREAVQAYILGMPNSSVIMSLKTLELGLKHKLGESKANLIELINKLGELDEFKKDLAHGLRILRNIVAHEDRGCDERDALETLRHVSEILNRLFPFSEVTYLVTCNECNTEYKVPLNAKDFYLGNIIRVQCPKCKVINTVVIGEYLGVPKLL